MVSTVNLPVSLGGNAMSTTRNSTFSSGYRRVAFQAATMPRYRRSASTGRFSGLPVLYLPAVVSPAHPVK